MQDLGIYTTQQLVEELLARSTWAGVIIQADKEIKSYPAHLKNFILDTQNLNPSETHVVLAEAMKLLEDHRTPAD